MSDLILVKHKTQGTHGIVTGGSKRSISIFTFANSKVDFQVMTVEDYSANWAPAQGNVKQLFEDWTTNTKYELTTDAIDQLQTTKMIKNRKALPMDTAKVTKAPKGQPDVKAPEPVKKPTLQERIAAKSKTKLPGEEAKVTTSGQTSGDCEKLAKEILGKVSKPAPKAEPKPAPKTEPKPAPKAKKPEPPKPAPKAKKPEPKPAPKAKEPAPKSKKPEPKPAPKPAPKKDDGGSIGDQILKVMVRGRNITVNGICEKLGVDDSNPVRQALFRLKARGLVEMVERAVYSKV